MTALYIHIPFCAKKCFYCSFVICVGQDHRAAQYLEALDREAASHAGQALQTIYVGGGTPSCLPEPLLETLMAIIRRHFVVPDSVETTIEVNPESVDGKKAKCLRSLGFNRVSLGIQTLNDRYLRDLGRPHTQDDARRAFDALREAGFQNINVDMMYAFAGQTQEELKQDLEGFASLKSEHISLYTLTVEKNSLFFVQKVKGPDNHHQADQYRFVTQWLTEHGYEQYEISNFFRGEIFASRHNIVYWTGGNYIGLGLGAHSHADGRRSWNVSRLAEYLSRMESHQSPEEGSEQLSSYQRLMETVLIGLRMNKGVHVGSLEKRFATELPDATRKIIEDCVREGFLIEEKGNFRTTLKGRLVLDEICSRLI